MKSTIINLLKSVGLYKSFKTPSRVSARFTELAPEKLAEFRALLDSYNKSEMFNSEENRQSNISAMLTGRLDQFRNTHIPFIVESIGLEGKKVLEIGCGSGSSTVAMAEQGAQLTGIDINTETMQLAKKRLEFYGQEATILELNANDIDTLEENEWDVIIFFASIEHMTPEERHIALQKAFSVLKKGGHLCILGTPNRLWPVDIHTSFMPFYLWLQDGLAFDYAKFSTRTEFAAIADKKHEENKELFYRWGRGVSFHEIELALNSQAPIKVVGSLPIYLRRHSFIQRISYKRSHEYKFKEALQHYGPKDVHPGFYECYLDVIMEKN